VSEQPILNMLLYGDFGDGFCNRQSLLDGEFPTTTDNLCSTPVEFPYTILMDGDFGNGYCFRQALLDGDFWALGIEETSQMVNMCPVAVSSATVDKSNFLVVYNKNDTDSRDFAEYYASIHNLEASSVNGLYSEATGKWEFEGQLVGINCSNIEILANEAAFIEQVEEPLQEVIARLATERTICGLILGYKVPGGYTDGSDKISATSRLSTTCIRNPNSFSFKSFSKKARNPLYDRAIYKKYDFADAANVLIVSRIDAPSIYAAKEMVNNADYVTKRKFADGTFYFDAYSNKTGEDANSYETLLKDFGLRTLPKLNLTAWRTREQDEYTDVVIPFVKNDSFVWSWFTERAYQSFFQLSDSPRVFFYNADFDGALTLRDSSSHTWPTLATTGGYASTAGSLSNPGYDGFLNPNAFFNALINKATLGEAYLYSVPYLNWTTTLIGDPLIEISFPDAATPKITTITDDESYRRIFKDLAKTAAYLYKKAQEVYDIRSAVVDSTDLTATLDLLKPSQGFFIANNRNKWTSQLQAPVIQTFDYICKMNRYSGAGKGFPTIDEYLTVKNMKISRLLAEVTGTSISESNLLPEGYWEFDFICTNDAMSYVNYYFHLYIYDKDGVLVGDYDTGDNISGWYYEKDLEKFYPIPYEGVPTSYIGRRIRYISRKDEIYDIDEYLNRGQIYAFKVVQYTKDINGDIDFQYPEKDFTEIIYT